MTTWCWPICTHGSCSHSSHWALSTGCASCWRPSRSLCAAIALSVDSFGLAQPALTRCSCWCSHPAADTAHRAAAHRAEHAKTAVERAVLTTTRAPHLAPRLGRETTSPVARPGVAKRVRLPQQAPLCVQVPACWMSHMARQAGGVPATLRSPNAGIPQPPRQLTCVFWFLCCSTLTGALPPPPATQARAG